MKKKHLDLIDSFVSAYKLLIQCLKAVSQNNITHEECEKCMKVQVSLTSLITDIENSIKKKKLYNEEFLSLKQSLNECVKNYYKLTPQNIISSSFLENNLYNIKLQYNNSLK